MNKSTRVMLRNGSLPVAVCLLYFACSHSPFDNSPDIGSSILTDTDSTLTSFDHNFKPVKIKVKVLSATSGIDASSTSPAALHRSEAVSALGMWDGDSAFSYLDFNGDSLLKIAADSQNAIRSVTLRLFSTISWAGHEAELQCDLFKLKDHFAPYTADSLLKKGIFRSAVVGSAADSQIVNIDLDPSFLAAAQNYVAQAGGGIDSAVIDHYDTTYVHGEDTTTLPPAGVPADSIDTLVTPVYDSLPDFALTLSATDTLLRFSSTFAGANEPQLILRYQKTVGTGKSAQTEVDSLFVTAHWSDYTMRESNPALRNSSAIVRADVGRSAEVTLDLTPFWNQVRDTGDTPSYRNILGAYLVLPFANVNLRDIDSAAVLFNVYGSPHRALADTLTMAHRFIDSFSGPHPFEDSLRLTSLDSLLQKHSNTGYLRVSLPLSVPFASLQLADIDSVFIDAVFSNPR